MSREDHSAKDLETIAKGFDSIAQTIRKAIALMEEAALPTVMVHSKSVTNAWLPKCFNFAGDVESSTRAQIYAAAQGVVPQVALDKQRHAKIRADKKKPKK